MISVTILAKNSAKTLEKVLDAVAGFDEVLLYDTGSEDATLEIAKRYANVRTVQRSFEGFGVTHNKASHEAKNSWILSIDSDEEVTPELFLEIQALRLDPNCVYRVRRKNLYKGRWIWSCGWYPDSVCRLYHKESTKFSDDAVHEKVLTENLKEVRLSGHLLHRPFHSSEDFLRKMQHYSTLFAKQRKGQKASFGKALFRGLYTFCKSYLLKKGALQGSAGFEISFYNGATTFYKYLKLAETP